jgi:preprotein translocase subunit SecF
MYNIIGNRKIFLTISAIFVLVAALALGVFRFHQGIDFKGGALWTFKTGDAVDTAAVQNTIASAIGTQDVRVSRDTAGSITVRMPDISEAEHATLRETLSLEHPSLEELSYQSIGPSVGIALRNNAITALFLVLIGISLYIAFAFRKVYRPISSWKYGWITLLTLLHDVIIPAGLLAILGHYKNIEIDTNFLVALLVVMGFSVHDTIVVFDRIRENLLKERSKTEFESLVNQSVNQTLGRSVNTSLTLILVLLALYFAGPASLHYFVLTLLVGVITGIYSSIFVASPLLIVWQGMTDRSKNKTKS